MENENNTYLADWLANKISDSELRRLVSEEDFIAYQKLKNTWDDFMISDPDLERNYNEIKQKIKIKEAKKTIKVFSIWKYRAIAVAAGLLLFFGLFQIFYFSNETQTGFGIVKTLTLPDDSRVTVNAKSNLTYPNFFQYNRTLKLDGEAFFEVQKGSTFIVKTSLGNVKVLGTKFNVISNKDYFEVTCYQGKVEVHSKNKIIILTPTETVRFYGNIYENWAEITAERPMWLSGETTFKNVPIKYVIDKFKNQYGVEVNFPKAIEAIKFSGTFTNKNIETALKSICIPLNLKFDFTNSKKIVISE